LLRSEKTFCKSLRRSQPIQEEEEELQHQGVERGSDEEGGAEPVIFSRDSLEPEGESAQEGWIDTLSMMSPDLAQSIANLTSG
jgi:hypothetical protein